MFYQPNNNPVTYQIMTTANKWTSINKTTCSILKYIVAWGSFYVIVSPLRLRRAYVVSYYFTIIIRY